MVDCHILNIKGFL